MRLLPLNVEHDTNNNLWIVLLDDLKLRDLLESISPSNQPTVSLWDYLKEELTAADFESTQELKRERVANFLNVPVAFEKVACLLDRRTTVSHAHFDLMSYACFAVLDACLWVLCVSRFISVHIYHSPCKISPGHRSSLPLRVFQNVVLKRY